MNSLSKLLYLLFGFFLFQISSASGESCDSSLMALEGFGNFESLKETSDSLPKNPFTVACQGVEIKEKRPLYYPHSYQHDGQTYFTQDLLTNLADCHGDFHRQDLEKINALQKCQGTPSQECAEFYDDIRKYVGEARMSLSLAQDPNSDDFLDHKPLSSPNKNLKSVGYEKEVPWLPLTDNEFLLAQEKLKEIKLNTQRFAENLEKNGTIKRRNIPYYQKIKTLETTRKAFLYYQFILSSLPIIEYLSSPNPSDKEIQKALAQIKENSKQQLKELEELKNQIYEESKKGRVSGKAIDKLFSDQNVVETCLIENPKSCGLAASIELARRKKEKISFGLSIGAIAASFFMPPLILAVEGVGGSLYYLNDSYKEKTHLKKVFLSQPSTSALIELKNNGFNSLTSDNMTVGISKNDFGKFLTSDQMYASTLKWTPLMVFASVLVPQQILKVRDKVSNIAKQAP